MPGPHRDGRRAFEIFLIVCAPVACDLDGTPLYFPWPDAHSEAFILMELGEPPLARAGEGREPVVLTGLDEVNLYALQYDAPLAALDLSAGELGLGSPCRSCALLTPRASYWLHGEPPIWEPISELPPALTKQLVPDGDPRCSVACPAWAGELEAVPWSQTVFASVSVGAGLILGTLDGRLYRLDEEARAELLCSTPIPGLLAVALREPAELWVATDSAGAIWRMDLDAQAPDQPCVAVVASTAPASLRMIAVTSPPMPIELVGIAEDRGVHHFDGQRWTQVATLVPADPRHVGGSVWMGDRRFAVTLASPQIAFVENGVAVVADLPVGAVAGGMTKVGALGLHPELGLLVAADGLGIVRWSDRSILVATDAGVDGMVIGRDRLAMLDRNGTPYRYHLPSRISCAPVAVVGNQKARHGMWLPDGGLFIVDAFQAGQGVEKTAARYRAVDACAATEP